MIEVLELVGFVEGIFEDGSVGCGVRVGDVVRIGE